MYQRIAWSKDRTIQRALELAPGLAKKARIRRSGWPAPALTRENTAFLWLDSDTVVLQNPVRIFTRDMRLRNTTAIFTGFHGCWADAEGTHWRKNASFDASFDTRCLPSIHNILLQPASLPVVKKWMSTGDGQDKTRVGGSDQYAIGGCCREHLQLANT